LGFAAFFRQVGRKPADDPREVIVFNSGGGEQAAAGLVVVMAVAMARSAG